MRIGNGKTSGVRIGEYAQDTDDKNGVIGYVQPACDSPQWSEGAQSARTMSPIQKPNKPSALIDGLMTLDNPILLDRASPRKGAA